MSFILFTDSNSDIPFGEVAAHDLKIVYMPYSLDGSDEVSDLGRGDVIPKFYAAMRAGKTPTTSLLTKEKYIESFEPYLQAGQDILFICFSSCFRLFVPSVHGLWVRIRTAVFLYRILPSSTPFCNCVSQHQRAAAPNSARKMPAPLRLIRVSAGSLCPDKYRNPP